MRARGAKVTDIVVLVVAADDGVMPQTVEAINHAQAAEVPIVVAVNKIDKEGANPAKIRQQLTEYGLVAEEYGGDTMFVDVSATTRHGHRRAARGDPAHRRRLAGPARQHRAGPRRVSPSRQAGQGRGPVATVLVQRGTLPSATRSWPATPTGASGRMLDEHGNKLKEALPSRPVQVVGLTSVPRAGDTFLVVEEDRVARQIADRRQARIRNAQIASMRRRITPGGPRRGAGKETRQLNLIIKGDNSGTVEALEDALMKIEVGDEVVAAGHPPRRRRHHQETTSTWRCADDVIVLGLQRPGRGSGHRAGRPRGRGHPVLHGHLPGHRRDRGRAQGHAQARVRGGRSSARRRSARSSGPSQVRQHRRLAGPQRRRSGATPRPGCCATAPSSPTT